MGYTTAEDTLTFSMDVPEGYDHSRIETVYVAGTFNDWEPDAAGFAMTFNGDRNFNLAYPCNKIKDKSTIAFKCVVNGSEWYVLRRKPSM